ncbi:MAG: DUF5684 domain-containing protein [Crocinitomicaceae bacterium]|nr:DUF5684 domain-containing protein [Crocinitomicaceae bacterium]
MIVYLKNFAIWLGSPLLLIWILPLLGIYLPFLNWIVLIGGTILGIVKTHKQIGKKINFGKAFGSIAIILGVFFILGLVRTIIEWGVADLEYMIPYMLSAFVIELLIAAYILILAGVWYMFEKAGKPGWGFIIPIYNIVLMCEIAKKPTWWVAMFFIPIANLIFAILLMDGISKSFHKNSGFTVGLVLLGAIFMPILGYGDSVYGDGKTKPVATESTDLLDN